MAQVTMELPGETIARLRTRAQTEQRTEQELLREAVERFLHTETPDPYAALKQMIGLVPEGPTDASVYHDIRPEEPR